MNTVFFTGFPGFLGSELVPRILSRSADLNAACLVQPKYTTLARQRVTETCAAHPALDGRIEILEGDIATPGLGLGAAGDLKAAVVEIYHLAAVYDLTVGRDLAMRVNHSGTTHMLDFAGACSRLKRFHYVSTCYVSGTRPGPFSEDDLECGQGFHNFYEESKYLAEVEVRRRMSAGLPATIYRPSVVVGDSRTGATQKYDGPYSVIRLLLRQPALAMVPVIGDSTRSEVNVVPRDFVVEAIASLSAQPDSRGCVYHLADPHPLTVDEMLAELARATGRKALRIRLPLKMAKASIRRIPAVRGLVGIPADALDYFVHPARYVSARTQAVLKNTGIRCPRFPEYAGRLVGFVRTQPEIGSEAMA